MVFYLFSLLSVSINQLIKLLRTVHKTATFEDRQRQKAEIKLLSSKIALELTNERHYMETSPANPSIIRFDPRFLVFEFTYGIMLRKAQVILVKKFIKALGENKSMCHQMIMGAGKTTVVAPLLALILADGKSLVTSVMPHALLEMTRSVMREKFSAVVRKPIFTFNFDRSSPISRELYMKLCKARDMKAVMCATPTSVKSLFLRFIEMIRLLERSKFGDVRQKEGFFGGLRLSRIAQKFRDRAVTQELKVNPEDIYYSIEILKLFKNGVLLLDEVDLLLHPLKSELNWPIGLKEPLDFTQSKLGNGLRWDMQWHLLDAVFYASSRKMTVAFDDSREAKHLLESISTVINGGLKNRYLQKTPHLVLLNSKFYHNDLKPLLARWQLLYLRHKRLPSVEDKHLITYMTKGHKADRQATNAVSVALSDEYMKMLNLSHDLLCHFVPFLLGKIDRVNFGLLTEVDLETADPKMSLTRLLTAVPFVGKDVPSRASQFSQPDVVIGLTSLAYRYEGLRFSDFKTLISELRECLDSEVGPFPKRPSSQRYAKWITLAGGKVRGMKNGEEFGSSDTEDDMAAAFMKSDTWGPSDEIWPLFLLDVKDETHMNVTYNLLKNLPQAIEYYLNSFVFPITMELYQEKLCASGQDLGGDMIFGRRVGFSGTPSDLLPEELGQCQYEECIDGQILQYMTDPSIVSTRPVGQDWNAQKLLDEIVYSSPPFNALLDTGALITGMSNLDVAKYLIDILPKELFDGVVFLDAADRQMILLRHGMNVVRLKQAGIPARRRFAFYDQIHTTGMDIKHAIDARAAMTLGKDMTFRDYAQGAFRMRGIGIGQTIQVFIIPEVMKLVDDQIKKMNGNKITPTTMQPHTSKTQSSDENRVLSLYAPATCSTGSALDSVASPARLLIDIASWLTLNGMRSENTQFRLLCEQSMHNIWRKDSFNIMLTSYRELTQAAFSNRVKEISAVCSAVAGDMRINLESLFNGERKLFADDLPEIKSVLVKADENVSPLDIVGIPKIQRCLDIYREKIDFTVLNNIPLPIPMSVKMKNEVDRHQEFLSHDNDKAVAERIILVLTNSENLLAKVVSNESQVTEDETALEQSLQREQVRNHSL